MTIISPMNGQRIAATDSTIQPLVHAGEIVKNGRGEVVMNNQWIYVNDGYGNYSINTVRADYCIMQEMKKVTIMESIDNKKVTKRLQRFIDEVSGNLVFTKYGKTYRVFLKKITSRTYDIAKIVPYWTTTALGCNRKMAKGFHNYQLAVDIDETFHVKGIM